MDPNSADALSSTKAFFQAVPWCDSLISEPGWTAVPTGCRQFKASTEDSFFAVALQTPSTISQYLTLCQAPFVPLPASKQSHSSVPIPAVRTLMLLGTDLNGFPAIAHGGLLAALLDEEMGTLLTVNKLYASESRTADITAMTILMNVRYRAPVKTPGIIMVEAILDKKDGRKTWLKARVVDENGKDCVTAEGMFLDVPASRM